MLTEQQAREIASEWHGGQSSYLYAFASSGSIDHDRSIDEETSPLLAEIAKEIEGMAECAYATNSPANRIYYQHEERRLLYLYCYVAGQYADGEVT